MYGGQRTTFKNLISTKRGRVTLLLSIAVLHTPGLAAYELLAISVIPFISMQKSVLLHIAFKGGRP